MFVEMGLNFGRSLSVRFSEYIHTSKFIHSHMYNKHTCIFLLLFFTYLLFCTSYDQVLSQHSDVDAAYHEMLTNSTLRQSLRLRSSVCNFVLGSG